jgi:cytoskeletal protein CcmA (bactofilin family)
MFGSKKSDSPTSAPAAPEKAAAGEPQRTSGKTSEITAGLTVVGRIDGDGDVRLDGRLEGDVRCRALIIGETGELIGRVSAEELTVHGRIEGDVRAQRVRLEATAAVIGDVAHDVLEVAAGATIEGRYSRGAKSEKLDRKGAVEVGKEPPPRAPQRPLAKPAAGGSVAVRPATLTPVANTTGASDA